MKYIDAEKLLAEIERRRLSNRYIDTEGYENELLEIITSLQQEQPEVDLEEEIERFIEQHRSEFHGYFDLRRVARHFYKLGLNARKEEGK